VGSGSDGCTYVGKDQDEVLWSGTSAGGPLASPEFF